MNSSEKTAPAPMIVIVGESASGKSTLIRRYLQRDGRYSRVITYTTRQPRPGEQDGADYHFIDRAAFLALKEKGGFFAETDCYRDNLYGTALRDLGENKILTVTPDGLYSIRERAIPCLAVWLSVDRRSRLIRGLERGDDIEEMWRRNCSDVERYAGMAQAVDYVIHNDRYQKTVDELAEELEAFVNGHI